MTYDRAWVKRPLVAAPHFGRSVPDVWTNTVATFVRRDPVTNAIGGFAGATERVVATVPAYQELATDSGLHIALDAGPVRRRHYLIIVAHTAFTDATQYPRKGDTVRFTDEVGIQRSMPVEKADRPEGIADHWEIETQEFE